jgi:hypothetical protein
VLPVPDELLTVPFALLLSQEQALNACAAHSASRVIGFMILLMFDLLFLQT